jgi:predicted SAM-dependent methyltransferase
MKIEYIDPGNKNNYFWFLKILIKIILYRLPFAYQIWQKIGIFRHGKMDDVDYAINTFFMHIRDLNLDIKKMKGKTILELGPGDSAATALIASSLGAKCILVDTNNFISNKINFYYKLEKKLLEMNYNPPKIHKINNVQDLLKLCNSHYFVEGKQSMKSIKSNSVDLIFSMAVLEHLKLNEFETIIKEMRRVLKDDGLTSHEVDLKDHLNKSLNNLRFSKKIWESKTFSNSGFYTNRIRYSKIINIFEASGFKVQILRKKMWNKYPIDINLIDNEFRFEPNDELLISSFNLITN